MLKKSLGTLIAGLMITTTVQAGGGGTNTETLFALQGLSCLSNGELTATGLKTVDLKGGELLTLAQFQYDIFDGDFEFFANVDGCYAILPLKFGKGGLLARNGAVIGDDCALTASTLVSTFVGADLEQLEDNSVHVTTNLSAKNICSDSSAKVIAIYKP